MSRLYGRAWSKARAAHLLEQPWCVLCMEQGAYVRGTVVDHKVPHRGDVTLFWDESNWQSLCKLCHDSVKQAQEKSGHLRGAAIDGRPLDPLHHWNTRQG